MEGSILIYAGFSWNRAPTVDQEDQKADEISRSSGNKLREGAESSLVASSDNKDHCFVSGDLDDWFSSRWSCKGGDWKRNDEAAQDRPHRKKLVLNDGYPLCQMPKCGYEDPRWHHKDELYHPSQSRRLELPPWAFSCLDEKNQIKPNIVRGMKGTMLPVVRINACVVKEHGSFVSDSRTKVRGRDRYSSRSARPQCASSDPKRASTESDSHSKSANDQELHSSWKGTASFSTRRDSLLSVDNLQLHLGNWYYFDGAGNEQGPLSFSELQVMVDQGVIPKNSSVFRKFDRVWVPVTSAMGTSEATAKNQIENLASCADSGELSISQSLGAALSGNSIECSSFHSQHPQFVGYTRGKLHELVMKSYKSREFAAAINEILDPWIHARQPKKEMEKHIYHISGRDEFLSVSQGQRGLRLALNIFILEIFAMCSINI